MIAGGITQSELEYVQQQPCFYCWPTWNAALNWDERGNPCCAECAKNPQRVCSIPRFAMREVHKFDELPRAA